MGTALIGIGVGLAALGCIGGGIGTGLATSKAVEATGRQPEASGKILTILITGAALSEFTAILSFLLGYLLMGKI